MTITEQSTETQAIITDSNEIILNDLSNLIEQQKNKILDLADQQKKDLTIQELLKYLLRNERGDAELFLNLLKDKYIFDSSESKLGEFYFWNGIHWQIDRDKQRYRDMELVSKVYEWAANKIKNNEETKDDKEAKKQQDELFKRAYSLRTAKRCKAVFEFVASEIPFRGDWDYTPGLLPCANGIIDLKTGAKFPPRPDYLIKTICPVSYDEDAKCPRFEKFLDEITLNRTELRACIEDAFGSSLIGTPKEELIFYLYGEEGRNGKGTLLQTIEKVLGKFAKTFPSEMLLLQKNPPNSDNPSPALANLQGVRFAIFSEINKGRKIDSSKVKNLSGRDTIPCRRLFSNVDLEIKPSHTMFIQTNFKPEAPADDNALWTRNVLIPFEAYFCDSPDPNNPKHRQKDPELKTKLLEEKEGILAWLVRCCINYQKHGLRIPDLVKKATADYRRENDGVQLFIDERCTIDSSLSTPCAKINSEIKIFCEEFRINKPTEREISKRLEKLFQKKKTNSGWRYLGIGITPNQEDEGMEK